MYEKRRFLDIANPFACKVEHTYGSLRNHSINQTLFFYNVTTLAAHLSLIESCADPDTQYNRNPTKELRNAVRMRPSARGHPHDVICTMQSAQGKSVTAPTATTTAMTATTAVTARYNGRNKYGSYDSPDGSSGHNGYNRQDSYVQQAQQDGGHNSYNACDSDYITANTTKYGCYNGFDNPNSHDRCSFASKQQQIL